MSRKKPSRKAKFREAARRERERKAAKSVRRERRLAVAALVGERPAFHRPVDPRVWDDIALGGLGGWE